MKEYLSIGELANIFGMDVQLLRYYDACGILVPSVRNEANGRRYYHFDQVYPSPRSATALPPSMPRARGADTSWLIPLSH